jgi:hypothetical protein
MFKIISGKGFYITFENGWTVSVQFGPGNYCDNYGMEIGYENNKAGEQGSTTAECACLTPGGDLFAPPTFGDDTVRGHMTAEQVLELMQWAAAQT